MAKREANSSVPISEEKKLKLDESLKVIAVESVQFPKPEIITEQDIVDYYFKHKTISSQHLKVLEFYSFKTYDNLISDHECLDFEYNPLTMVGKFKTLLLYSILNYSQKVAFKNWFSNLAERNPILLGLDAPAGTGKSFLIKAFLLCSKVPFIFCSYRHDLVNTIKFKSNHRFYTTAKFMCSFLKVGLYNTTTKTITKNSIYTFLYFLAKILQGNYKKTNIIIDEYTVLSPFNIATLLLLHKYRHVGLIFVGDSQQQHTINKTTVYNLSNKELISLLNVKFDELTYNMRSKDDLFVQKLNKIKNYISNVECSSLLFNYMVYQEFRSKFYLDTDYSPNVIYLAYKHKQLKKRLMVLMEKEQFKFIPYYVRLKDGSFIPLPADAKLKFPTNIPIKIGYWYLYTDVDDNTVTRKIVKLISTSTKEYVFVDLDGEIIKLKEFSVITPQHLNLNHLEALKGLGRNYGVLSKIAYGNSKTDAILSFPIQPLCVRTFHSVQGMTFSSDFKVEIDTNDASSNSIYVGLTRCPTEKNLGRIYSKYLNCFEYSMEKNDGYLYIFNSKPPKTFKESTTPKLNHKMKIINNKIGNEINHITPILDFFLHLDLSLINLSSRCLDDIITSVETGPLLTTKNDSFTSYLGILDLYINSPIKFYDDELLKEEYEIASKVF